jgi:hypothetical protein
MEFIITRHSKSCNQGMKIRKSFEPSLTYEGIRAGILRGFLMNNLYESDLVYVSCLVRTWMTALLLYNNKPIQNFNTSIFNICIIPDIKEKAKQIKRGNYPTNLKISLLNYLDFLDYLISDNNEPGKMNFLNDFYINYLPNTIRIFIYTELNGTGTYLQYTLVKERPNSPYKILGNCNLFEKGVRDYDPFRQELYTVDGDINMCINRFLSSINSFHIKQTNNKKIHIVAHSSLIRTFLNNNKNNDPVQETEILGNKKENNQRIVLNENNIHQLISKTNMASIVVISNPDNILISRIYKGVKVTNDTVRKDRHLCFRNEFTTPFTNPTSHILNNRCNQQGGFKKSKKKKTKKKTKKKIKIKR